MCRGRERGGNNTWCGRIVGGAWTGAACERDAGSRGLDPRWQRHTSECEPNRGLSLTIHAALPPHTLHVGALATARDDVQKNARTVLYGQVRRFGGVFKKIVSFYNFSSY